MSADEDPDDFVHRAEYKRRQLLDNNVVLDVAEFVSDIVLKLPPNYSELVTTIEQELDSLSLSDLQGKLRAFYQRKVVSVPREAAALAARAPPVSSVKPSVTSAGGLKCSHCNKLGHTVAKCWSKHGKPDDWTPKKKVFGRHRKGSEHKSGGDASGINIGFMAVADTSTTGLPAPKVEDWVLDSGASAHMTGSPIGLINVSPLNVPVTAMNNSVATATCTGDLPCTIDGLDVTLYGVIVVPAMGAINLLSLGMASARGVEFTFLADRCNVHVGGINFIPTKKSGLWTLPIIRNLGGHSALIGVDINVLHRRFGHVNHQALSRLASRLDVPVSGTPVDCVSCELGKSRRTPVVKFSDAPVTEPLTLLHTDFMGPNPVMSLGGSRYAQIVIDNATRVATVSMHKNKSAESACAGLDYFIANVPLPGMNHKVGSIRTDCGGEFSGAFSVRCNELNIKRQFSPAHTQQINGVAERALQTITQRASTIMHHGKLSDNLWGEAINTACYLTNRAPHSALGGITPIEALCGVAPAIDHLYTPGCLALIHIEKSLRHGKLDARAAPGIFVGYAVNKPTGTLRVYNPATKRVVESFHVKICDNILYSDWQRERAGATPDSYDSDDSDSTGLDCLAWPLASAPVVVPPAAPAAPAAAAPLIAPDLALPPPPAVAAVAPPLITVLPPPVTASVVAPPRRKQRATPAPAAAPATPNTTRSGAVYERTGAAHSTAKLAVAELDDVMPGLVDDDCDDVMTRQFDGPFYNVTAATDAAPLFAFMSVNGEPTSYGAAMASPDADEWQGAMDNEVDSLESTGTWREEEASPECNIINTQWVFKVKKNSEGVVVKYKARVVAQGNNQVYGVDFSETFAPVAAITTVRTLLAVSAALGYYVHQIDYDTAYLNAPIEEEVWVRPPPGYKKYSATGKPLVYKLLRSLYGLKQSGRNWNNMLNDWLIKFGFERSAVDTCLYIYTDSDGTVLYVIVYVDDLIPSSGSLDLIQRFKASVAADFKIKDLGQLEHFLGIHINYDRLTKQVTLDQTAYINGIIHKFGFADCTPITSPASVEPLSISMAASTAADIAFMETVPYRSAVGSLLYAAVVSRPDISNSVREVSRFLHRPGPAHWNAVSQIFKYLKKTVNFKLAYNLDTSEPTLSGYCDADLAGDIDGRKSTTGYIFMFGGAPLSWRSSLQPTVALSSTEAEYMALTEATNEAISLRQLLADLHMPFVLAAPTVIYEDNQGAIKLASNPIHHRRTKHIDIKYHHIRHHIINGTIKLVYINTAHQLADSLTKRVNGAKLRILTLAIFVEG